MRHHLFQKMTMQKMTTKMTMTMKKIFAVVVVVVVPFCYWLLLAGVGFVEQEQQQPRHPRTNFAVVGAFGVVVVVAEMSELDLQNSS